jgi:hypothetical protein
MTQDGIISHAEALRLIDTHLGERVYYGFFVTAPMAEATTLSQRSTFSES